MNYYFSLSFFISLLISLPKALCKYIEINNQTYFSSQLNETLNINPITFLGTNIITRIASLPYTESQNVNLKLDLSSQSMEWGTDDFRIWQWVKNNRKSSALITTFSFASVVKYIPTAIDNSTRNWNEEKDEYEGIIDANCSFTQQKLSSDRAMIKGIIKYEKLEIYLNKTFGWYNKNVYRINGFISPDDSDFKRVPGMKYIPYECDDFFLRYDYYSKNMFWIALKYTDTFTKCTLYIIDNLNTPEPSPGRSFNWNKRTKVYDVQVYNYKMYICSDIKNIQEIDISANEIREVDVFDIENYDNSEFIALIKVPNMDINIIYAIEKNVGLIVFDQTRKRITQKYEHTNMNKLDLFINPNTGTYFIGVWIVKEKEVTQQEEQQTETFIELIWDPITFASKINKIWSVEGAVNSMVTFDSYFTYWYDYRKNRWISFRRGLVNSVPVLSFIIYLNIENPNENSIVSSLISQSGVVFPIVLGESNMIYYNTFTYEKSNYVCYFAKTGEYAIGFSCSVDSCANSWGGVFQNAYCTKHVIYYINIPEHSGIVKAGVIIGCISVGCWWWCIIVWAVRYNKWLKENRMKIVTPDKTDKWKIYIDGNRTGLPGLDKENAPREEGEGERDRDSVWKENSEINKIRENYLSKEQNKEKNSNILRSEFTRNSKVRSSYQNSWIMMDSVSVQRPLGESVDYNGDMIHSQRSKNKWNQERKV